LNSIIRRVTPGVSRMRCWRQELPRAPNWRVSGRATAFASRQVYPLYGHEISADISPLTAGLAWTVKLDKGVDFNGTCGARRRRRRRFGEPDRVFQTAIAGSCGRSPVIGLSGEVGRVVSRTLSPILNEAIGSALVIAAAATQPLTVDIRGAKIALQLVKPPFVRAKKT